MRVLRLLRGFEVLGRTLDAVSGILGTNGLTHVLGVVAFAIVAAGLFIHQVEPQIGSPADGIWWSLVTATTVGYGDISPKTLEGRIIAAILMLVGIGTIGMVTGSITTYFIGRRGCSDPHVRHIQAQLDRWDHMQAGEKRQLVRVRGAMIDSADAESAAGETTGRDKNTVR